MAVIKTPFWEAAYPVLPAGAPCAAMPPAGLRHGAWAAACPQAASAIPPRPPRANFSVSPWPVVMDRSY